MATLVILEDADYEDLSRHLGVGGNVVLARRAALESAGVSEPQAREFAEGYDCDGDADVWVDLVGEPEHLFAQQAAEAAGQPAE